MDYIRLIEQILLIVPGASLAVWEKEPPFTAEEDTSTKRHVLFGYTVCWATSNTAPCPTEEDLLAIPLE